MRLEEFNALPQREAVAVLLTCAAIPAWADDVAGGRPYTDAAALAAYADARAAAWTGAQVEAALADHPRIGERHQGGGASAELSSSEQAGVDPADAEVQQRLAEGNRRYEERFDRIYLVRAAGRDAQEILALLDQRLTHDPATELAVTTGQLREIAALRLAGLIG